VSATFALIYANDQNKTNMHYSQITVLNKTTGSPINGVRVALSISGVFSGGVTPNTYTNRQGIAEIQHESTGSAKVMVRGTTRTTIQAPGQTTVYI